MNLEQSSEQVHPEQKKVLHIKLDGNWRGLHMMKDTQFQFKEAKGKKTNRSQNLSAGLSNTLNAGK